MFKLKLLALCVLLLACHWVDAKKPRGTTFGREFVLGFGRNYDGTGAQPVHLYITVTSIVGAAVTIKNQADVVLSSFTLAAGEARRVEVDAATYSGDTSTLLKHNGIRVTATADVSVVAENVEEGRSVGATLVYPVSLLGKKYTILTFDDFYSSQILPDCFLVVATADKTRIRANLHVPAKVNGQDVPAGRVTFELPKALDAISVCSFEVPEQLGESELRASKPVAIFAYNVCTTIPACCQTLTCDHLFEAIPRQDDLGNEAIVFNSLSRSSADYVRVVAIKGKTDVAEDGEVTATLKANEFVEYQAPLTRPYFLNASKDVMVFQYAESTETDGQPGGPYMMHIPSPDYWLSDYLVATLPGFKNYFNLAIRTSQISTLSINGNPVSATWEQAADTQYSITRVAVDQGAGATYRVQSSNGTPFNLAVYGFVGNQGYGFNAGLGY